MFPIEAKIEFSISSGSKNLNDQLNLHKNQMTIEQMKITDAARLKNARVFSSTSLNTYLNDGILYSGSSEINAELLPLKKNFFMMSEEIMMTTIDKK